LFDSDAPGSLAASTVAAEETLDIEHYDVTGDHGSLGERISRASPVFEHGRCFHGHTRWRVDWQFDWALRDGLYRSVAQQVGVHGRILLPRLEAGCPRLQQQFDRYLECLRLHELGHFEFARQAAVEIERRLAHLTPALTAGALQRQARREADAVFARYRAAERRYDIDTGHGRTQGAVID